MRALTYHGPSSVAIDEKPEPRIEHPGDIILRVTGAAICGSDLHLFRGLVPDTRVGHTFGHEFVGVVEEAGSEVMSLQVGDKVLVPFNISCGACFFCQRDLFGLCDNVNPNSAAVGGVFGYSHTTGGYDGGQAEYVRVPFADVGPWRFNGELHEDDALLLTDVVPTGYQAAEMGDIGGGETVVVFGCGPVGLFAQKFAWLMGAGRVIAVDKVPFRLGFAHEYNQVETINFEQTSDIVAHLREMTGGRGPDVVIDAVGLEADGSRLHDFLGRILMTQAGSPTVIDWAIHSVRKGGTVVLIGVYGPPFNLVPIGVAMQKGLTLRMGQCNVRRYLPQLVEQVREGRIDPKRIITHRFGLDDAPQAYELFARKEDDCLKVALTP